MSLRKELIAATSVAVLTSIFNDKCLPHPGARPKLQRRWKRTYDARLKELTTAPVKTPRTTKPKVTPASKTVKPKAVTKTVAVKKPRTTKAKVAA